MLLNNYQDAAKNVPVKVDPEYKLAQKSKHKKKPSWASSSQMSSNSRPVSTGKQRNSSAIRSTTAATTPIKRASENLELINDVFRQVSVQALDELCKIRKPSKTDVDACSIFCRFINAFRESHLHWDIEGLRFWDSIKNFIFFSPSSSKIAIEVQQIKKKVLRPHITPVPTHTLKALEALKTEISLTIPQH